MLIQLQDQGQEGETPSPLGSILKTVITLAGPNRVQVVNKDEGAGITDVQIYQFTPVGAQVPLCNDIGIKCS